MKTVDTGPAYAIGRENAPYLFVLTHKPSEGMNAWFLQKLLDFKIDQTDCRFVFMLDEPPKGASNKPVKDQTRSSWSRFAAEVRDSSPRVVVPLGSDALYAVTGIRRPIVEARGYVITNKYFKPAIHDEFVQIGTYKAASRSTGAKKGDPKMAWKEIVQEPLLGMDFEGYVIPMFQLDHIRVDGFACTAAVNADLLRARRACMRKLDLIDQDFIFETSLTQKLETHKWGNVIAVDIETHGVDNEVIDCVSISDGTLSATLPWSQSVRDLVSRIFIKSDAPDRYIALHNSPFDLPRLEQSGVEIPKKVLREHVFDTMFAGVVLQPDLLKALGAMASIYLDLHPWKPGKSHLSWCTMDTEQSYSAKDAFVTAKLALILMSILKDMGMWNLFMGQGGHPGPGVMATLPMLTRVSREGIKIDRVAATVWCKRLEKHSLRLLKMWYKLFPTVSPSSPKDLRELFYKKWDLPPQKTREDGLSTDELACMRLREYTKQFASTASVADEGWRHDPNFSPRVFDLLLAIRNASKQLSTYAQPVAESGTSYIHPQYLPAAKDNEYNTLSASKGNTATGRLAAYNPNIQNQPKRARWLYIPNSPDMCFVQADYVRAEPYSMAYMAKDRAMISDLESGDLYESLRGRLLDMGYKGLIRKTCKNVFLAGQYLAGGNKVSEMILRQDHVFIDPVTCKEILRGIATAYSDVAAYKRYLVQQCETKQYVRNPFGRVRFFYDGRGPAAVDFIPQSIVADVLWCVMLEVDEVARSLGGRFTLTVHDSILVQVPEKYVHIMVQKMQEIMSRPFDCVAPGFRIPVDFETAAPGVAWGGVKKYALSV